jgi:hypothetical protein
MPVTGERLSSLQIATLKQLAICTFHGGQATLTQYQREVMVPLWRTGLLEMWFRQFPDPPTLRGPFFRPTDRGWRLIGALFPQYGTRSAA